jgi:hypothetical protein
MCHQFDDVAAARQLFWDHVKSISVDSAGAFLSWAGYDTAGTSSYINGPVDTKRGPPPIPFPLTYATLAELAAIVVSAAGKIISATYIHGMYMPVM